MGLCLNAIIISVALTNLVASSKLQWDKVDGVYYGDKSSALAEESGRQSISTGAPNFIRLVVMRLIYGIASTMGVEDRLEDAFNGAFVPPNSDGFGGFGDFGGGDDGDGGLFGDIFEDDGLL